MKRKIWVPIVLLILVLLALLVLIRGEPLSQESVLDLGRVAIDSPVAREFLGADSIKIRNLHTDYRPSGELPILGLEAVTDRACREIVEQLVNKYSLDGDVYYTKDVFALKGQDVAAWVSRSSGAFKMTRTGKSMSEPASIGPIEALQMALDHVAKEQLVQLSDNEELDVLFVSGVKNALVQGDAETPEEEFVSDHYVAFGRRYKGIPIVGSELVLRLDGSGTVAMIERVWRRIEQFGKVKVRVPGTPIEQLIVRNPDFRERLSDMTVPEGDIHMVSQQCGLLEAPADFRQEELRPGCMVAFRLGEGHDEGLSQLFLSLETNVSRDRLLGRRLADTVAPAASSSSPEP